MPENPITNTLNCCGKLERIAQQDPERFVSRCTCGSIHLDWDFISVQFQVSDFYVLEHLIYNFDPNCQLYNTDCYFAILRDSDDQIRIWLGSFGLKFSFATFNLFKNLLHTANLELGMETREQARALRILGLN